MARRVVLTIVVFLAAACVPALAALTAPRAVAPPQLSMTPEVPAFTLAGMVPGDSMTRCVRVRNEGDTAIALAQAASLTGALAPYLRIAVQQGSLPDATTPPACSGFVPGGYVLGTSAAGVAPAALTPQSDASWPAHAARTLRVTVAMPSSTPVAAASKTGTLTLAFAGAALDSGDAGNGSGGDLPSSGGDTNSVPLHGFADDGKNLTNRQVKKLFKVFRPRLLKNGDVAVPAIIPTGGAVRAKVILPGGAYYAARLYKALHSGHQTALLLRRPIGVAAVRQAAKRRHRLVVTVTFRYRWRHGDQGYAQRNQRFVLVRGG